MDISDVIPFGNVKIGVSNTCWQCNCNVILTYMLLYVLPFLNILEQLDFKNLNY